jgi:hypothetical protein
LFVRGRRLRGDDGLRIEIDATISSTSAIVSAAPIADGSGPGCRREHEITRGIGRCRRTRAASARIARSRQRLPSISRSSLPRAISVPSA